MKKHLLGLLLLVMIGPVSAAVNVGVVNVHELLQRMPEAAKVLSSMEKEFSGRKNALQGLETQLKTKSEALQKDKDVLNDSELKKRQKEVIDIQRKWQDMGNELREDVTRRQQEETQRLLKQINAALIKVAKNKKYDLIIHRDAAPYVADSVEVTEQVMQVLAQDTKKATSGAK